MGLILYTDLKMYYSSFQELTASLSYTFIPTTSFLHDEDSLTTFVWERGVLIQDKGKQQDREEHQPVAQTQAPHLQMNFTIDAATIGSGNASALTRAQMETWGRQVRYFFGATESDDADPKCNADMTSIEMVFRVTRVCRQSRNIGTELRVLSSFYANEKWIGGKANPIGWLCGHQRFPSMLGKVGKFYQRELANAHATATGSTASVLPDFLLIQDDDTYYNMNMLQRDLFSQINPSTARAIPGCLVHAPIHMANFSFPYGGYGTILSRGAILRMIQPIYCNSSTPIDMNFTNARQPSQWWESLDDSGPFLDSVCQQLEKNTFGEQSAFRDGMSVSDLMRAHAAANPFREFESWRKKPGYCFHGDWLLGYYINYYNLAGNPSPEGPDHALPHFNMDPSLGYIYGSKQPTGNCVHEAENCPPTAHFCHRQNAETMARLVVEHDTSVAG